MRPTMISNIYAKSTQPLRAPLAIELGSENVRATDLTGSEACRAVFVKKLVDVDVIEGKSAPTHPFRDLSDGQISPKLLPAVSKKGAPAGAQKLAGIHFDNLPDEAVGSIFSYVHDNKDVTNLQLINHRMRNLAQIFNAEVQRRKVRYAAQLCVDDPGQARLHLQRDDVINALARSQTLDLRELPFAGLPARRSIVKLAGLMEQGQEVLIGYGRVDMVMHETMSTLSCALKAMPKLEKFNLVIGGYSENVDYFIKYFWVLDALKSVKSLKEIVLRGRFLRDDFMEYVFDAARQNPNLSRLELPSCVLETAGMRAFKIFLEESSHLTDLILDSWIIWTGVREDFLSALRATQCLESVSLNNLSSNVQTASVLGALSNNRNLQSLKITFSLNRRVDFAQIGTVVSSWKKLQEIDVSVSKANDDALAHMVNLAAHAAGLKRLTVRYDAGAFLPQNGAGAFERLAACEALEELYVAVPQLDEDRSLEVLGVAMSLPKLKVLDLSKVEVCAASVKIHKTMSSWLSGPNQPKTLLVPAYRSAAEDPLEQGARDALQSAALRGNVTLEFVSG